MARGLQSRSFTEALADTLRERLIAGEIPPGARVTEAELAQEFEVSRPTARAAVETLVAQGLLRRQAHKSAQVPALTAADVKDVYFTRQCFEEPVARLLAETRTVPNEAQRANDEVAAVGGRWSKDIVEPDLRFHRSLIAAVSSERTSHLHRLLLGEAELCMAQIQIARTTLAGDIAREHQRILDAIKAGDPDEAAAATRSHLDRACRDLTQTAAR